MLFLPLLWKCAVVYTLSTVFTCSHYPAGESNMPPAAATNLGYTPPDGGWGWAVVFGAFISIGFSYAFPKSLTIYFKEIQEYFSISYSEIAWLSSVMLASMYAGGQWHCIFLRIWQRYFEKKLHIYTQHVPWTVWQSKAVLSYFLFLFYAQKCKWLAH